MCASYLNTYNNFLPTSVILETRNKPLITWKIMLLNDFFVEMKSEKKEMARRSVCIFILWLNVTSLAESCDGIQRQRECIERNNIWIGSPRMGLYQHVMGVDKVALSPPRSWRPSFVSPLGRNCLSCRRPDNPGRVCRALMSGQLPHLIL